MKNIYASEDGPTNVSPDSYKHRSKYDAIISYITDHPKAIQIGNRAAQYKHIAKVIGCSEFIVYQIITAYHDLHSLGHDGAIELLATLSSDKISKKVHQLHLAKSVIKAPTPAPVTEQPVTEERLRFLLEEHKKEITALIQSLIKEPAQTTTDLPSRQVVSPLRALETIIPSEAKNHLGELISVRGMIMEGYCSRDLLP